MVQIYEDQPSFASKILSNLQGAGTAFGKEYLGQHLNLKNQQRENEAQAFENQQLGKLIGQDLSGIRDPKIRQEIVGHLLKGQLEGSKKPDLSGAMGALNQLETLVGKKGIGFSGNANFSSEARKNRGIFESTQAAILPLFKSMFPRGMTEKEFKFINDHYIPQSGDTEATIRGKIQGLRQLMGEQASSNNMTSQQQERPPLSSFER